MPDMSGMGGGAGGPMPDMGGMGGAPQGGPAAGAGPKVEEVD
jgi:hypothetical protein